MPTVRLCSLSVFCASVLAMPGVASLGLGWRAPLHANTSIEAALTTTTPRKKRNMRRNL